MYEIYGMIENSPLFFGSLLFLHLSNALKKGRRFLKKINEKGKLSLVYCQFHYIKPRFSVNRAFEFVVIVSQ
jgi:hypothetical protein